MVELVGHILLVLLQVKRRAVTLRNTRCETL